MKYIITLLLCLPFISSAQNIPNAGFEIWYIGNFVLEAEDWRTSNFYTAGQFGFYSANPDWENFTEGYTSVRLTTFQQDTFPTVAAYIVSGSPMMDYETNELDIMSGGTPFPYRPTKMIGQYQFQSGSPIEDFGQVHVILKKYNSSTGQADTIGYGQNMLLNPTTGFQTFEVPIQYSVPDVTPDSVIVIFYSTYPQTPIAGGELWVDDLSFDFSTSISIVVEAVTVKIFPNPFKEFIKVTINASKSGNLELLNVDGKIVASQFFSGGSPTIEFETAELSPGIYYISWRNENRESQILEKVVKVN